MSTNKMQRSLCRPKLNPLLNGLARVPTLTGTIFVHRPLNHSPLISTWTSILIYERDSAVYIRAIECKVQGQHDEKK